MTETKNGAEMATMMIESPEQRCAPRDRRALVVIPTYEEAENIEVVLRGVRLAAPTADILVIDDNSSDGTAERALAVGAELGQIEVLRRTHKAGLGSAYRTGFAHGVGLGYGTLVEMDADLSHDPASLPSLLDAVDRGADLAIGSRYVPGGSIPVWPARRRAISRWGNRYAAFALRLEATDLTSGYRAFRAASLRAADADATCSTGFAFQIELARRIAQGGGQIVEVPIVFTDRVRGESKMSLRIAAEAFARVSWWALRDRVRRTPSVGRRSEGLVPST